MSHSSSQTPKHERFITFTPDTDEGGDTELPALVINPKAVSSIELQENGTSISINLISGMEYRIDGLLRPRARALLRDLLRDLGEKNAVTLPAGADLGRKTA